MNDLQKILLSKTLFTSQRNKLKSSYILITLVVILLVISQIFVDSMTAGISKRYALLGSGHIQCSVLEDVSSYDFISEQNDVSSGSALVYGKGGVSQIVALKGVDKDYFDFERSSVINIDITSAESTLSNIYISKTLSHQLNIGLGEKIAIISDNGNKKLFPKLCFVKGVYDSGYRELDQYLIFCDKLLINKIYNKNIIQHKEIILKDGVNINNAINSLASDGISSVPWYVLERSLYKNLITSTQTLMIVFLSIALLSGFFISAVASDLIGSSHRTIAINKLLGLSNKKIRWNYFLSIELVTLISILSGTILGVILSYILPIFLKFLASKNISSLSWYLLDFEIIIPYKKILLIICFLFVVSIISVHLSLRRTKRIEPLDLINQD